MYITSSRSSGFGTMEILISVFLSGVITLACATLLSSSLKSFSEVRRFTSHSQAILRTRAIISASIRSRDTHPFFLPMRIQTGGSLNYTDGTPNNFRASSEATRPDIDSSSITSTILAPEAAHRTIHARSFGERLIIFGCPIGEYNFDRSNIQSFVGVHADGLVELRGNATAHAGRPECSDFEIQATPSMIVENSLYGSVEDIQILIPIKNSYTIYLSQNGTLRYLGHEGDQNIENQPLVENILGLNLSHESIGGINLVQGTISLTTNREHSFSFAERRAKTSHFNFLMNFHS